ncbi:MAG TPA: class I SAM-dependent methyltransferase [Ktedonobacterales bacterium]|nr:class I SAM-dependent methyltransferase [Ktedonobacterales bacterium]
MSQDDLAQWFAANRKLLESAYLAGEQPWQQSGFGLHTPHTAAEWEAHRRPIADALDGSGSFLDVGCANGYLLECLLDWVASRGLTLDPYGVDFAPGLIALARKRLPQYADHFFVANAWDWSPPRRFTFVRASLDDVPDTLHTPYITRLLTDYLEPEGRLVLAEYRVRGDHAPELTIDQRVAQLGFSVSRVTTGAWARREVTRVAVIHA